MLVDPRSYVAGALGAAEPRIGKFVKYDTGDFTIITSRSGTQAREIMEELAKFRVTSRRCSASAPPGAASPRTSSIVSESEWQKYLQPRQNIAGYFQRARFDNYMVMNGDARRLTPST